MVNKFQEFGRKSEELAAEVLKERGYRILETNYRTRAGEIDIIARDRDVLVFVEVKARRSGFMETAKEAVTYRKQRKISVVALTYLKKTRQFGRRARFDVVAIDYRTHGPEVEIVKNAFEIGI